MAETLPPQASNATTQSAGSVATSSAAVSSMLIGIIVAVIAVVALVCVGCWFKRDALFGIASSASSSRSSDGDRNDSVSERSSSKSQSSEKLVVVRISTALIHQSGSVNAPKGVKQYPRRLWIVHPC